jgi:hypothetical protein
MPNPAARKAIGGPAKTGWIAMPKPASAARAAVSRRRKRQSNNSFPHTTRKTTDEFDCFTPALLAMKKVACCYF